MLMLRMKMRRMIMVVVSDGDDEDDDEKDDDEDGARLCSQSSAKSCSISPYLEFMEDGVYLIPAKIPPTVNALSGIALSSIRIIR